METPSPNPFSGNGALPTLAAIRTGLLAVLVLGAGGTLVELLLLKHTEGFWQLIPIVLLGLALLILVWFGLARSFLALRALQLLMLVYLVSGGVGAVQHFLGNVTYELESNPSLSGMELYLSALKGSTPALAPGTMIQLGLIGLLFAFRHPILSRKQRDGEQPEGRI